jgi:hypothetical protein
VATWPLAVAGADGCVSDVARALGPGGPRVVELLDRLASRAEAPAHLAVEVLARSTPAGTVDLPVAVLGLDEAVLAAGDVDPTWLAVVDERRSASRAALRAGGREVELEAALNLAMLLATDRLEGGETDLGARVASGARLWLLGAAVSWALTAHHDDPFAAWAELLSYGLWPVGPVDGRLVVSGA